MQGLEKVGEKVIYGGFLANAAKVVLKLLEESSIVWLSRTTGLFSGQLCYLFLQLLHTDPEVPKSHKLDQH